MKIVEQHVSDGNREIFDFDQFMARPLFAHLAHESPDGPRESPVWFYWDKQVVWIIGGSSFPDNLSREPRCAVGIVDWNPATGILHHVGLRGRAEILPFDLAVARTIFRRYLGADEATWDSRFDDVLGGQHNLKLVRIVPLTVVMRDQSYRPGCQLT